MLHLIGVLGLVYSKGAGRQKYVVSIITRPVSRPKQVAERWAGAEICVLALLHGQAGLELGIQRVKT